MLNNVLNIINIILFTGLLASAVILFYFDLLPLSKLTPFKFLISRISVYYSSIAAILSFILLSIQIVKLFRKPAERFFLSIIIPIINIFLYLVVVFLFYVLCVTAWTGANS